MPASFFSIISCARNAGPYARRSIESVLAQTEKDWELFFIDDASDDNTLVQALASCMGVVAGDGIAKDEVQTWTWCLPSAAETKSVVRVLHLPERRWKLQNFLDAVSCADGHVIVELDGDDWFSSPDSLAIIRAAYDSSPRIDATAGSFHGYPTSKIVHSKLQPAPGYRFMQNGFSDSVPAPRTWKRELTERSLKELPQLYINPETGSYWKTNSDIALFAPALFWATDIASIQDVLVEVNWETEQHDDMLDKEGMRAEGLRLYEWSYQLEWDLARGLLEPFRS